MKTLFQFIVRIRHFLLFLLLEVVAFLLIGFNLDKPQTAFLTASSAVVGTFNSTGDNIVAYFTLRHENEQLNDEICHLQQQVLDLQNRLEPQLESDSSFYQYAHLCYGFIPAKVIDLSTDKQHNYLTINKGARDGIREGVGVVANGCVVGIVSVVNERFSLVVPLIHTAMNLPARILRNGDMGFTHWDGTTPRHVQLTEIGRHSQVAEGDTIITSGMTLTFPEGLLVGVVDKAELNEGDNYYRISIRLGIDYHNIRYVQVLDNTIQPELDSLTIQTP